MVNEFTNRPNLLRSYHIIPWHTSHFSTEYLSVYQLMLDHEYMLYTIIYPLLSLSAISSRCPSGQIHTSICRITGRVDGRHLACPRTSQFSIDRFICLLYGKICWFRPVEKRLLFALFAPCSWMAGCTFPSPISTGKASRGQQRRPRPAPGP